jgi:VWFA-related protein
MAMPVARPLVAALAVWTLTGAAETVQQRPPVDQRPPVFRSSLELRQLDVTVLDRDRRPVSGLTVEDFTLTEDGVPQKIEAFSFVAVEGGVRSGPVWASSVASDVVTNDLDSARVFAIVVDDIGGMGDVWARNQLPDSLRTFVSQLGPDDVAAVIFHGYPDRSVNFTRDKARLAASADWYPHVNDAFGGNACIQQAKTMLHVARNLATLKNRRKTIVLFGGAIEFVTWAASSCGRIRSPTALT